MNGSTTSVLFPVSLVGHVGEEHAHSTKVAFPLRFVKGDRFEGLEILFRCTFLDQVLNGIGRLVQSFIAAILLSAIY